MKLLIATGIYPPEIGGPAGYVKSVATELARLGHDVVVITYGDNPELNDKFQIANIKRGDSTLVRYVKYTYQTWKMARKADVIYAQGPVSEGLPAALASIFARKPLALKIVGDYAWEQYQQTKPTNIEHRTLNIEHRTTNIEHVTANQDLHESKFQVPSSNFELLDEFITHRHKGKIWLMEAVERWVASRAKTVIVPSKYLKTIVEKWGIDADKIKVVYNSIAPLPEIPLNPCPLASLRCRRVPLTRETSDQTAPLSKGDNHVLRDLGDLSDERRRVVLTAVRAVPWKGGDFLCDVIKELRGAAEVADRILLFTAGRAINLKRVDFLLECVAELPDNFIFAIAGDGPSLETWKQYAKKLGLEKRIMWLGQLNKKQMAEYYQMADIFLLASSHETAPHVVVEAASSSLPCIISDKGGNPEIADLFPGLVAVAPYQDKQAWIEAIKRTTNYELRITNYELPESLGFERMIGETVGVLESTQCLNLDRVPPKPLAKGDYKADSQPNSHDYSNNLYKNADEPPVAQDFSSDSESKFQVPSLSTGASAKEGSKFDSSMRVLSIGLEKKLFEPGKVRDRIVNQLQDFDTTIIVFAKQKFDEQIAPHARVISTNSRNKFFYVMDALRIIWQLRKQKFNVIISQDPTETGLVAYLASKFLKSALAIQDHGYHFHGNYYRQESWLNQFRYLFARFVVTRAHAVRVVSQRTENALEMLGIAKERIVRFPVTLNSKYQIANSKSNLVNSEQWSVNSEQRTAFNGESCIGYSKFQVPSSKFFLVACRFVPIKRIDLAIHAFSIFAMQNTDVKLKIVGGGPLEYQIKQWIAVFDLQDSVETIPWTENLADLYHGAIATLITSDGEGFGMTAVESLSCGTPIIMTDVGCAGEVVVDGVNGIVVPVGDVIALADSMNAVLTSDSWSVPFPAVPHIANMMPDFINLAIKNHNKTNQDTQ
jgi:glycosyltransferase involved in cell wall biosynthesis